MNKETYCTICPKERAGPFKGDQGLNLHNTRMHSKKGKTWGNTGKGRRSGLGQEKVVQQDYGKGKVIRHMIRALTDHPEGLTAEQLLPIVKQGGYRSRAKGGKSAGKVFGTALTKARIKNRLCPVSRDEEGIFHLDATEHVPTVNSTQRLDVGGAGGVGVDIPVWGDIDNVSQIATALYVERQQNRKRIEALSNLSAGLAQILGQVSLVLGE